MPHVNARRSGPIGLDYAGLDHAGFPAESEAARVARLAASGDVPVFSPVHRLQSELAVFERGVRRDDHYPGWFRVGFPIAASIALWTAILWGVSLAR